MTSVIARAAIVPVLARPALRAEQVTQLVLGETACVDSAAGDWLRVVMDFDQYRGWAHRGYLVNVTADEAAAWRQDAGGWSEGATIGFPDGELRAPLRARLVLTPDGGVRLPDARTGRVVRGAVLPAANAIAEARAIPPAEWASERFDGAPYLWGGVTPNGVDCSGLVQTTFAARGIALPRDAVQQAECGTAVAEAELAPGDLLFFRSERGPKITHVAFAGPAETLVHSTVAHGGVVVESRASASARPLLQRLVAVRRIASS